MDVTSFLQLKPVFAAIYPSVDVLLHASHEGGNLGRVLLGGIVAVIGAIYAWRVTSMSGLQTIWTGIAIEIAGFGGDAYWHSIHGADKVGLIPPAHWLIILGAVVALVGATRAWENADDSTAHVAAVAGISASAQMVGAVWDNALHYAGTEPAPTALPHLLKSIGLILLLLSGLVAAGVKWRMKTATATE